VLLATVLAPFKLGPVAAGAFTVLLILPMGPMLYRIAFDPIATSSVLVLLIAAFGVHFSLMGCGLVFFGPEGVGTAALSSQSFELGSLVVTGQSVVVLAVTIGLLVVFAAFFEWSLVGKALRAFASNRIGARLSGIPAALAGQIAFAIAAGLGAVSGVLIGPLHSRLRLRRLRHGLRFRHRRRALSGYSGRKPRRPDDTLARQAASIHLAADTPGPLCRFLAGHRRRIGFRARQPCA